MNGRCKGKKIEGLWIRLTLNIQRPHSSPRRRFRGQMKFASIRFFLSAAIQFRFPFYFFTKTKRKAAGLFRLPHFSDKLCVGGEGVWLIRFWGTKTVSSTEVPFFLLFREKIGSAGIPESFRKILISVPKIKSSFFPVLACSAQSTGTDYLSPDSHGRICL